jgi:putative ABC transport system permease protein
VRLLNWLSQVGAVTMLNLRTLGQRRGSSLTTVFGVAGVVTVVVALLSIAEGFRITLASTGSPDTVVVLRGGAEAEMMSGISRADSRIIADAPGLLRSAQGPDTSAELYVIVDVPKRSTGTAANVPLRGVQPAAFLIRKDLRILSGRRFEPGRNEVIVGNAAEQEFAGLGVGSTLHMGENNWQVVGTFSTGGTVSDSEIWADADVVMPAYRRQMFQSVHAKLDSPQSFNRFKDALTTDPRLDVKVIREGDYYAEQSRTLTTLITVMVFVIGIPMSIGAVFGALLTMYSAVASRTREIATLRALGFGGGPVVISVLTEALLLAIAGGVIGGAAAYLTFNGFRAATLNWQTFSQVAFAFRVTPGLLLLAVLTTLPMGLVGGIFPAIRATRMAVSSALREV